ncbi:hypothetical protein GQ607_010880 [Colletotrichum asianum]|uniref:Uncharacterized protein n=1 Tax=Colletotrichum asianum TaxID=702518 RepID=A0A8H3WC46_9PEZI|nr:hypothetical protein GQ607_010880 [Colletotrichum asianum]
MYSGKWDFRTCTHCFGHARNPCDFCGSQGVVRVPCPHRRAAEDRSLSSKPRTGGAHPDKPGPRGPRGPANGDPDRGVAAGRS